MAGDGQPVIIAGIEGGGGHSVIVLFNSQGDKLIELQGPSTNHWLVGMEECQKRIIAMVRESKEKAGLPSDLTFKALGLALSGCEDEETNQDLKDGLIKKYPDMAEHYYVCSDTIGAIATASEHGGLVIISGTGSNSFLLNPDLTTARCGGLGYLMGDEGSAWWIADQAIKYVNDEEDNRRIPPADTTYIKKAILEHFKIKTRFGLLEHCYVHFNKALYAALALKLAEGARQGDALCLKLFYNAGFALGEYIGALLPSANKSLLENPSGIPIICVGAVWGSFPLMKDGLIAGAQTRPGVNKGEYPLRAFTLLQLRTTLAVGAAYLGSKAAQFELPRDYNLNADAFFHHEY